MTNLTPEDQKRVEETARSIESRLVHKLQVETINTAGQTVEYRKGLRDMRYLVMEHARELAAIDLTTLLQQKNAEILAEQNKYDEAYARGYKEAQGEIEAAKKVTEDTSDGYHTFKELYDFRLLYNVHLFNEWAKQGKYDVHKSQRHNDGELCFGRNDYFIVVATLPTGQISNHYPMSDWDLFKCEAVEKAKAAWDGHTSQDVAKRLREALT